MATQPQRNALLFTSDELLMKRLQNELRVAVLTVGDKEARRLWKETAKQPKGHPKGSTKPAHDAALLESYDLWVAYRPDLIKSLPRIVGEKVHENAPGQFGASANAVEARLRRALTKRDKETGGTLPPS